MEKILFADGPDLTVAEEAGQTQRPQLLLNQACVVVRPAEQAVAAAVATAEAPAVNRGAAEPFFRARQQRCHVFRGSGGVPALKLNRLAEARQCADGNGTGARVCAKQVANQKIAALEFLQILVHH